MQLKLTDWELANLGSNFNITKFKESHLHKCITKTASIVRTTNLANEEKKTLNYSSSWEISIVHRSLWNFIMRSLKVEFCGCNKRFSSEWRYQFMHSLNQYTSRFLPSVFVQSRTQSDGYLTKFKQLFGSIVLFLCLYQKSHRTERLVSLCFRTLLHNISNFSSLFDFIYVNFMEKISWPYKFQCLFYNLLLSIM